MDNAQKAIMIGVGLFITIIIISAVLLITNLGTGMVNNARTELGTMSTALQSQILDAYDGATMSGSELLAALRQYATSTTVSVIVTNGTDKIYVGAGKITLPETVTDYSKYVVGGIADCEVESASNPGYSEFAQSIYANKYYKTAVCYDKSGKLVGFAAIQL